MTTPNSKYLIASESEMTCASWGRACTHVGKVSIGPSSIRRLQNPSLFRLCIGLQQSQVCLAHEGQAAGVTNNVRYRGHVHLRLNLTEPGPSQRDKVRVLGNIL